jgi:hypothetical protein
MRIHCLACQDEFFVNSPLDVKENDEHALDFALHLSYIFRSAMNRACHSNSLVRFMLSSPNAGLINARASITLLPRVTQNLRLFLCRIYWNLSEVKLSKHHAMMVYEEHGGNAPGFLDL